MIVTEEEAKTKRCQEGYAAAESITHDGALLHTVGQSLSVGSYSASGSVAVAVGGAPLNCIGSACMSWRWFDNLADQAVKTPRGFCGKAGKP